jgi:hypothetical protein
MSTDTSRGEMETRSETRSETESESESESFADDGGESESDSDSDADADDDDKESRPEFPTVYPLYSGILMTIADLNHEKTCEVLVRCAGGADVVDFVNDLWMALPPSVEEIDGLTAAIEGELENGCVDI